ncbi:MAG: hypothetical protein ACKVWV_10835 [Planctomycetota bacterium]
MDETIEPDRASTSCTSTGEGWRARRETVVVHDGSGIVELVWPPGGK